MMTDQLIPFLKLNMIRADAKPAIILKSIAQTIITNSSKIYFCIELDIVPTESVILFFNSLLVHHISSLSRAQQFKNEWEIQCMVLVSFSLQVFLFFFSGFRKRYNSRVLSVLLWLAYLSADSVAIFILGRLTLHTGEARHQLVLFWAPFLLLHLGGQETITAFSMEDNTLWKRHLLNLATQAATAIYVVSMQRQGNKQLVAPMVLMFISGTTKYAERIWALKRAGSMAPGSSSTADLVSHASNEAVWDAQGYYGQLCFIISKKQERNLEAILEVATEGFQLSLDFFMDMTPSISLLPEDITEIKHTVVEFKSSEDIVHMAYKWAEINLSLIYDYLYTKFGTRHFHIAPVCSAIHRIVTLVLTSVALALFVRAMADQKGRLAKHSGADVVISYILLAGAIILEICSILMAFVSSYWAYNTSVSSSLACRLCQNFPGAIPALLRTVRYLHPESRGEWSRKLAQYSMIGGCIQEKQAAGLLQRAMRWIGIDERAVTHIGVSAEVKKLLLDKLLEIASTSRAREWDSGVGKFHGQWAQWVVEAKQDHHRSAGRQALLVSNIQGLDFVSSVLLWHIVTDICLLADETSTGCPELSSSSRELSNYTMYLVASCSAIVGSEGHYVVSRGRREVSRWLLEKGGGDQSKFVEELRGEDSSFFHENYYPVLDRARRVSSELLEIEEAGDRWELIVAVWMEMLCHIACNCGAGFHAKHLTTGGEFVTHVKMLLFMLGVPFLRDVKESLFPKAGHVYS